MNKFLRACDINCKVVKTFYINVANVFILSVSLGLLWIGLKTFDKKCAFHLNSFEVLEVTGAVFPRRYALIWLSPHNSPIFSPFHPPIVTPRQKQRTQTLSLIIHMVYCSNIPFVCIKLFLKGRWVLNILYVLRSMFPRALWRLLSKYHILWFHCIQLWDAPT